METGHYTLPSGELIRVGTLVHSTADDWNAVYLGGENSGEQITVSGAFLDKCARAV